MPRTSHRELLDGCTKGEGWNTLTPDEMERVQALYAENKAGEA